MTHDTLMKLTNAINLERGQVQRNLAPVMESICHVQGYCHALRDFGLITVEESIEIVSGYTREVL